MGGARLHGGRRGWLHPLPVILPGLLLVALQLRHQRPAQQMADWTLAGLVDPHGWHRFISFLPHSFPSWGAVVENTNFLLAVALPCPDLCPPTRRGGVGGNGGRGVKAN